MILKLQNLAGYNPLRIDAFERAVGVGESTNDPSLRSFPDTFRGYNSRLAALLGLRYLILDRPVSELPRFYPRPRAALLFSADHFYIYRLDPPVVPRVHVASSVLAVDSDDIIDSGDMPAFDLERTALVEQTDADTIQDRSLIRDEAGTADAPPAGTSSAKIDLYADNRIVVDVATDRRGLLVLHDMFYPGWIATVDGHPTPILRTDLLFRGVEVPAGHHQVVFSFQPFALRNLVAAARTIHKGGE